MFNLVQKFINKDPNTSKNLRSNFAFYFFSLPEHQWLNGGQTRLHFEKLFQILPLGVIEMMMSKHPVVFVKSELLSNKANVGMAMSNTVVVFPEFQKLLASNKKSAVAYLAHEMAFLIYELEISQQDQLLAEVEADKFVCDIGLENELEEFLLMLDETIEKRLRLTYLTINYFTKYSV